MIDEDDNDEADAAFVDRRHKIGEMIEKIAKEFKLTRVVFLLDDGRERDCITNQDNLSLIEFLGDAVRITAMAVKKVTVSIDSREDLKQVEAMLDAKEVKKN